MNLMLLAAGEGTRLRPYTLKQPKPSMPLLGVPLAGHSLSFTDCLNIENLVVNTFHLADEIHRLFSKLPTYSKTLSFSDEKGQILDTGGGLGKARSHFENKGDLILMNADEVILPQSRKTVENAVEFHRSQKALATLFVMDHPGVGTEFGGVWTDAQNQVLGFGKKPFPNAVRAWHFIGAQILSDQVFRFIPEGPSNILYGPLTEAIAKGEKIQVFPIECEWFETGNPSSFLETNQKCLSYLSEISESFESQHLRRTLDRYSTEKFEFVNHKNALIWKAPSANLPNSVNVQGFLVLGQNCRIAENSTLENVVVNDNATIDVHSNLKDTIVL